MKLECYLVYCVQSLMPYKNHLCAISYCLWILHIYKDVFNYLPYLMLTFKHILRVVTIADTFAFRVTFKSLSSSLLMAT